MGTDSQERRPRSVRLSDAEIELFQRWAHENELTGQRAGVSNVMRELAVRTAKADLDGGRRRVEQPASMEQPEWFKEMRVELARVGGNLNQAQRSVNRGDVPSTPELLEVLQDVREWLRDFSGRLTDWKDVAERMRRGDQRDWRDAVRYFLSKEDRA